MNFSEQIASVPEYTREQWDEEITTPGIPIQFESGPFAFGTTLRCPACRTIGFYGARISGPMDTEDTRRYRACKFCGLWQEASGDARDKIGPKAYRCTAVVCPNEHYNWLMPEIKNFGNCEFCQGEYKDTQWAVDNPNHPFQRIKEVITNLIGV